ncbi:MAG: glycogen-binding domain-containing protein [Myxococcota bacterium]
MSDDRDPILEAHLQAWRAEEHTRPPSDLVNRAWTRAVVERQRQRQATGLRAWVERVLRPRMVRMRVTPAVGLAAAAIAVATGWVVLHAGSRDAPAVTADAAGPAGTASAGAPSASRGPDGEAEASAHPREVPVRFVLPVDGADWVGVAGDFNDWAVDKLRLEDPDGDGVFVGTAWLQPGTYDYMFVVDGERWVTDPYASNHRNDGFGQQNAVLRID